MAGGSMKLTEKAQGAATIDSYVLVTQMELPSDYVITGNEEEGELDAMKIESVRRIPTSEIVELVQDNLEIDDEPTDESDALITSGSVKAELDRIDEALDSYNEDLTNLQAECENIGELEEFVGDTSTDLGHHEVSTEHEFISLSVKTITDGGINFVVTSNTITTSGTATATKIRQLQDDFELQAGTYTFSIDSSIETSGYSLQVFNVTANTVAGWFPNSAGTTTQEFTLSETSTLRIRSIINNGTTFADAETHRLSLKDVGQVVIVKTTLADIAEDSIRLIGDMNTDLGSYIDNVKVDMTDLDPKSLTDAGVAFVITKTSFTANGTSTAQKLRTLQDNISAPAGKYRINIGDAVSSDGVQLQLFSTTKDLSVKNFTKSSGDYDYEFVLATADTLRLRILIPSGVSVAESHEIDLYTIVPTEKSNNLIHMIGNANDFVESINDEVGEISILDGNLFPVCTFIDDDTTTVDSVTNYVNACNSAGIKGTLATLTIKWESNTNLLNTLKTAERSGHNVILHAYSQNLNDHWSEGNFSVDGCTDDLVHGMQMMAEAGLPNYRFWATPDNTDNEALRCLARRVGMNCKFIGNNWANDGTHSVSRYKIYRCALNVNDSGSLTLAQLKAIADDCYAKNGWLIVMTHFANENQSGDYASRLQDVVNYVSNLGYRIMNVSEAWSYRRFLYDLHDML